jgi:hypothetical protein
MTRGTRQRAARQPRYSELQLLTAQLGAVLAVLLTLQFLSGALFFLYAFYYDAPPWFTFTRVLHFYVGMAIIPFVLAKYGATGLRAAGYYLRVDRFRRLGPPSPLARLTSPLLALDFLVIGISGLYMLFHVYYTITNIPPFDLKPVQTHAWASFIAVPLLGLHLGSHLWETLGAVKLERQRARADLPAAEPRYTRRALLAGVALSAVGLAYATQNGPLSRGQWGPFFIGRLPKGASRAQRFPIETLFGVQAVSAEQYRLEVAGAVDRPGAFTLADLAQLAVQTREIRTSCVSGWSTVNSWSGYLVRDVLALAGLQPGAKQLSFESVTHYQVPWPARRVLGAAALLATHVNGEPLSVEHGAPLRLIVPGYPGQDMVKQVVRIWAGDAPNRFAPDLTLTRALRSANGSCAGDAGET